MKDARVVVIGGTSGIGFAVAQRVLLEGAHVTPDLGGSASTAGMADAIIGMLGSKTGSVQEARR